MLYLKGLFTTDIYAPIIEQSQLACLTKSWRLKCKYSPSAFSSLLMQLPPQIGVRILQRPLLSIEASRANILFCFSDLYSPKVWLKKKKSFNSNLRKYIFLSCPESWFILLHNKKCQVWKISINFFSIIWLPDLRNEVRGNFFRSDSKVFPQ